MASLPTSGRVIIDTTVGSIEIDLWAKVCHLRGTVLPYLTCNSSQETPKATRNFLTLAMEGRPLSPRVHAIEADHAQATTTA